MKSIVEKIKEGFLRSLPGSSAHQKIMEHRKPLTEIKNLEKEAKISAVLILVYPIKEEPHVVLIKRHIYDGVHSGQIGFPGGRVEEGDFNLEATALREANEELKIKSKELEIIGQLTPLYIPPSNFIVYPFVAIQKSKPTFIPDHFEVEEIIELPLIEFLKPENLIYTTIKTGENQNLKIRAYQIESRIIWGATGMILKELSELILED